MPAGSSSTKSLGASMCSVSDLAVDGFPVLGIGNPVLVGVSSAESLGVPVSAGSGSAGPIQLQLMVATNPIHITRRIIAGPFTLLRQHFGIVAIALAGVTYGPSYKK